MTDEQKKIKDLETQVETLTKAKSDLEGQLTTATEVNKDLQTKLEEKVASADSLPSLKVGTDTYELTSPFFFKGQEVTIDVLKADGPLAKEVVKEGIANLRKVATKA